MKLVFLLLYAGSPGSYPDFFLRGFPYRRKEGRRAHKKDAPVPVIPGRERNTLRGATQVQKGTGLFLLLFFTAGREPRALPPPLGHCLPCARRRGLQPMTPFSVPVESEGTPVPSLRQYTYYSMPKRALSMKNLGKSGGFCRLFRIISALFVLIRLIPEIGRAHV